MTVAALNASLDAPPPPPAAAGVREDWTSFSRELPAGDHGADCWESHVAIEGMYCAACSLNVEEALGRVPGVLQAQVNAASHSARVRWSARTTRPAEWFAALETAGYRALPGGDAADARADLQAQRLVLWRWLVAGFCMMQVMMYALPGYTAGAGEMAADMRQLLRWASWVLTLPVLLFSCQPFFAGAVRDLRARRLGMDVPVALGIVIAFVASTVVTLDPAGAWGQEVWYDSLTMFVFFLLSGRLLEQRLRQRTAGALQALARRLPASVQRRSSDGEFQPVAASQLVPGDVIRVLAGESFPADGTVIEGHTEVDESLLSGESVPLVRGVADAVLAGSHNLSGVVLVRVCQVGATTRYAGIAALVQEAAASKPRIARLADRIARPFLLLVLVAAAAAALWWWPVDPGHAIAVAIAVLIVTCPCALSLATPVAGLAAAGALARHGVLVRHLEVLERCTAIDTVVFDKTGTLTLDRMAVSDCRVRAGTTARQALEFAAALACGSLHPVSRAIVQAAQEAGAAPAQAHAVRESAGEGLQGRVGEGPDAQWLRLGSAQYCGVWVPGVASGSQVHLADDRGWLASFMLDETVRPDAAAAVTALKTAGQGVQVLSGDRPAAAARLAQRLGIDRARGGCTPQDKLAHVRRLQAGGRRVAMVGDGVNDAPVLALADVSIALGHAAPLAQSRADVVVLGSQLNAVPVLLRHARRAHTVVRQNLAWAAGYNAVCVPLAVLGWMPPWLAGLGMAASSLFVVLNSARLARVDAP